jgi:RNA 3'-terminal phosphate cyclase (ATP)
MTTEGKGKAARSSARRRIDMDMTELDGSHGGGQLLRTALTLALCTGTGFTMTGIRAGRSRPGLMRQHLASVNAAAQVGGARTAGAELGSVTLRFEPGDIAAGDYTFAIGSAGSTTLVLQTVLPALARASGPSTLRLEGGTHNPMAPTADFIADTWLPRLRDIGYVATIELERAGFYPAGGGILHARIGPAPVLAVREFIDRGQANGLVATALLSGLSSDIGRRELAVLGERLRLGEADLRLRAVRPANGPGNVLQVRAGFEHHAPTFTGHGARGVSAETVANQLANDVDAYLQSGACIDEHLADQLLLPMALAGGGGFTTTAASDHLRSNAALIEKFLPVEISLQEQSTACWRVDIRR